MYVEITFLAQDGATPALGAVSANPISDNFYAPML